MGGWGGKSPKASTLWSNSRGIRKFATSARARLGRKVGPLADVYYDKAGHKRYKGNRGLKASQSAA